MNAAAVIKRSCARMSAVRGVSVGRRTIGLRLSKAASGPKPHSIAAFGPERHRRKSEYSQGEPDGFGGTSRKTNRAGAAGTPRKDPAASYSTRLTSELPA